MNLCRAIWANTCHPTPGAGPACHTPKPTCSVGWEGVALTSGVPAPMGEMGRKGGPYEVQWGLRKSPQPACGLKEAS